MNTHFSGSAARALQDLVKGDLQEKFPDLDVQNVSFCGRTGNATDVKMTVEVRVPVSEERAPKKAKSDKKKPAVAAAAATPAAAAPAAATEKRFGAVAAPRSEAGPSRLAVEPYAAQVRNLVGGVTDLEADFKSKAELAGIDAAAFKKTIEIKGTGYKVVGISNDGNSVYLWCSAKKPVQMVDLDDKLKRRIAKACE